MKIGIYHTDGREFFASSAKFTAHLSGLPKDEVLVCKKGDVLTLSNGVYTLNGQTYTPTYITARTGTKMAVATNILPNGDKVKKITFF